LEALTGLSELAKLGLAKTDRDRERDREREREREIEQRLLDERIRLLTGPGQAYSDRERIERYVAIRKCQMFSGLDRIHNIT